MAGDVNELVHQVSNSERTSGLMTVFQGLSREDQVALLEWSRSISIKLASVIEKQSLAEPGRTEAIVLPAPKPFLDIALRVGAIRALTTDNTNLLEGCEKAYRQILGDTKYKSFEEFKDIVRLTMNLSKW